MDPVKFQDVVNRLNILARNAITLALKFTNDERAKIQLEAYANPRKGSNDRAMLQQEWCDIRVAVDDGLRALEALGLVGIKDRYRE